MIIWNDLPDEQWENRSVKTPGMSSGMSFKRRLCTCSHPSWCHLQKTGTMTKAWGASHHIRQEQWTEHGRATSPEESKLDYQTNYKAGLRCVTQKEALVLVFCWFQKNSIELKRNLNQIRKWEKRERRGDGGKGRVEMRKIWWWGVEGMVVWGRGEVGVRMRWRWRRWWKWG